MGSRGLVSYEQVLNTGLSMNIRENVLNNKNSFHVW